MSESKSLELFHYGVSGMRWGVRRKTDSDGLAVGSPSGKKTRKEIRTDRKAEDAVNAKGYSSRTRKIDERTFGKGGAKRINRKMKDGVSQNEARKSEVKRRSRQISALGVVSIAAITFGPSIANSIPSSVAKGKKAYTGRNFSKKVFSDHGSHPVVSLSFDKTSNLWKL